MYHWIFWVTSAGRILAASYEPPMQASALSSWDGFIAAATWAE